MKKFPTMLMFAMLIIHQPIFGQGKDIALKAFELRMNGHPEEAMKILDSALAIYPDSARIWFKKGRCVDWVKADGCEKFIHAYTKMGPRLRQSKKCFKKAIRLDPENARYHYWAAGNSAMGSLLAFYSPWKWPLIRCKFKQTVRSAKKAVLYNPENPDYRCALVEYGRFGWILGGSKKLVKAHIDTLEMKDPVYAVRAHELLSSNKHPYDAFGNYKLLEPKYPDHPVLLEELTRKYAAMISKDSAYIDTVMVYYKKLMKVAPANPQTINRMYRFMTRYKAGDPVPWIQIYLDAVEGDYTWYKASGLRTMARAQKTQGNEGKSKACLEEADQICPGSAGSWMADMEKP